VSSDRVLSFERKGWPLKDYDERAKAWLKAVGGSSKYQEMMKQWQNIRGKNLLRR